MEPCSVRSSAKSPPVATERPPPRLGCARRTGRDRDSDRPHSPPRSVCSGNLPNAGESARRTGAALALVRDLVIEGVRPHWHGYRWNGDRAVIDVPKVLQHLVVKADSFGI